MFRYYSLLFKNEKKTFLKGHLKLFCVFHCDAL